MSDEQDSEDLISKTGAEEDIADVYDLEELGEVDQDDDLPLGHDLIMYERDKDFQM